MKKPTQKQLELAERIGLDVPDGVTRTGLSKLLDGAIQADRRERSEDYNLPNDLTFRAGVQKDVFHSARLETVRQKKLRRGDVVRNSSGNVLVVLGHSATKATEIRTIEIDTHRFYMLEGEWLCKLYSPPQTHIHELAVLPWPFADARATSALKKRLFAFREFADELLTPERRFSNEYGECWERTAVEQLLAEYDSCHGRVCHTCGRTFPIANEGERAARHCLRCREP